jgi:hypothetical protein
VYAREENFGLRFAFAINDFFAIRSHFGFLILDLKSRLLPAPYSKSEQSKIANLKI